MNENETKQDIDLKLKGNWQHQTWRYQADLVLRLNPFSMGSILAINGCAPLAYSNQTR